MDGMHQKHTYTLIEDDSSTTSTQQLQQALATYHIDMVQLLWNAARQQTVYQTALISAFPAGTLPVTGLHWFLY